jgi:hypothetical protein
MEVVSGCNPEPVVERGAFFTKFSPGRPALLTPFAPTRWYRQGAVNTVPIRYPRSDWALAGGPVDVRLPSARSHRLVCTYLIVAAR